MSARKSAAAKGIKNKEQGIIMNNEIYAAIAMALHDEQGYNMHDSESGTLTITPRNTEWASKQAKMTNK